MSVLPLSLFYGSRAEPRGGFLGEGHSPSGKSRGRVTSGPGLGAKLQAGS